MDSSDDYSFTLSELMKRNCDDDDSEFDLSLKDDDGDDQWLKEKAKYDKQFNQLQEQLVAAMMENQQHIEERKKHESKSFEELTETLEEEKAKRLIAESRLKILMTKKRKVSTSSCNSADHDFEDLSADLDDKNTYDDKDSKMAVRNRFRRKLAECKIHFGNFLHERISDFINDEDIQEEEGEEEELSVRRLKENVNRFTDAIQPIKRYYNSINELFAWKSPWLTVSIFIIYSYSFCLEMAIPLLLFLSLLKMTWNYIEARGIGKRFFAKKKKISDEVVKEDNSSVSLSERYQLVLLIAKQVQNTLGDIADSLEKLQNLFAWQHERASKLLFQCLLMSLAMAIILPLNTCFLVAGILTGIKLFVITPIYTAFPKVQRRYDEFQTLWEELPTHKENKRRKIHDAVEINDEIESSSPEPPVQMNNESTPTSTTPPTSSPINNSASSPPINSSVQQLENASHNTIVFCDRFQLPITEAPMQDWFEGRRCTMMDKESPLSSMKHGRMYLTRSYLCFERNQFHAKKNIAIKLSDIVTIKKAKPITFMPGQGMAIEIQVKDLNKPYVFGAMISRDEAFDGIIKAGRLLNLSWSHI